MPKVEMFFDCSSPWTYLAFDGLENMSREMGFDVLWRPFLVGGVFNAINPSVYEFRENSPPAKRAYQAKDIKDWTEASGLTIKWVPHVFPVNSVKAMRGCIVAGRMGKLVPFARCVFEIYWGEDKDISQDEVIADICTRAGVDTEALLSSIASQEIKDELRANTDELMGRGGFGSPTIFVGGDDMYFGNDRLPLVRGAIKRMRNN